MVNKATKKIFSNVGWDLSQLRLNKASTQYRRLGFTPANIKQSLRCRLGFTPANDESTVGWGSPQQNRHYCQTAGINPSLRKIPAFKKSQHTKNLSIQSLVGIMLFGTLLASTSHAQTCKTTSITATTPSSRFQLLASGSEVKDMQTGLIWQRCSLGQTWDGSTCTGTATSHNWQQALSRANALGNGYRLPNIKELKSIVERQCYDPAINTSVFPNTQSSYYWSSSPSVNYSNYAWGVNFGNGYDNYRNPNKYYDYDVRAVRSE